MAIRINLLAEAQALEEQRRKDPVKRALWIGGFCVSLVLLWMLKLGCDIYFTNKDYHEREQYWKDNVARYGSVTNNQIKTTRIDQKLAALDRLATNRFFWAPILNALQQTAVDNVQVIRLTGEQKYDVEESRMLGSGASKVRVPAEVIERVSLYIDAKDYDSDKEGYNKFKQSLCSFETFTNETGRADGFILDGTLGSKTVDPSDPSKEFVTFKLASHFKEWRRSE